MRTSTLIAESFDSRTLANVEVALERARKVLAVDRDQHAGDRDFCHRLVSNGLALDWPHLMSKDFR